MPNGELGDLLELRGIEKEFPGVKALKGVSFTVRPGEIHALCGENGAGKSTLIKVITGAHAHNAGEYLVDGKEVHFSSTDEAIGLGISCVYQELSIAPQLDVAQNLYIGNLPRKGRLIDHKKLYAETSRILAQLDLDVPPKTPAGELSVGQQQMIEIGRALTRNARCIIMDEPTSSLSEKEADTLFGIIRKLKARGIAIVYISHKLDEVMMLSDRITVIRDGENIVTQDTSKTTQDGLIAHMIGRSLENMYRKDPTEIGDVMLSVSGLTRPGVFTDVGFNVRRGEVVGFFGLVGAGRSEIMRALFGVDRYTEGEVVLDGKRLRAGDPPGAIRSGLGFCTEDRKKEGLMLRLTILLNATLVKLPLMSKYGVIDRAKQREEAHRYVESISIKCPSVHQKAGNLSGGNQQKVVLAKWLMLAPKVLIVDEPTRGIDVGSKAEIYGILNELAKDGMGIIVVSSEIEEIMGVCDRVITVFEGRVTGDFPVEGLSSDRVLAAALGKAMAQPTGLPAAPPDGAGAHTEDTAPATTVEAAAGTPDGQGGDEA
ncbi:MAG: sugar ABC transporter ATP-binding protein [Lachnospiraceae bacterium]|jgi:ribose transport system ATP-binding protein|nr:sugar ABC transporter ATP-binding protein [Lachnospiraceae bacterium]